MLVHMPGTHMRHDLPVFPPEIFDCIISQLDGDRRSLKAASLVCSNWLSAARRLLFRYIEIAPSTLLGFAALLCGPKSPTFLNHIHFIQLTTEPTVNADAGGVPNSTSAAPVLVNEELLSWFPILPFAETIIFENIKWDSAEVLTRFASLLPSARNVGLTRTSVSCIQDLNHVFRVFPLMEEFVWRDDSGLPNRLTDPVELPQLVSNTVLPSRLKSLVFLDPARDDVISHIPFGSIQLTEFAVEISTAENPFCLRNLCLFIMAHCLNISTFKLTLHVEVVGLRSLRDAYFSMGQS